MAYLSGFSGSFNPALSTIIPNTGQESGVINTGGLSLCGFFTPAALTSTAMTFEACATANGTFVPVKDTTGAALSIVVAASGYYAVNPVNFQGLAFLKLKSGTAEGADRIITCSLKGI